MGSAFFAMDLNGGAPLGGGKQGIDRVEVANLHYGPLTFVGKDEVDEPFRRRWMSSRLDDGHRTRNRHSTTFRIIEA